MREAVMVSIARTAIERAYKGAFDDTGGVTLASHAVGAAVQRAGVDPAEIEDVVLGCAMPKGSTGNNVAHQAALRAGLPVGVAGMTGSRCTSHLMAERERPGAKLGVATMCVGGGIGAAGLFEIV